MVKYWAQFAKTGDPDTPGNPMWPAYTAAADTMPTLSTPAAAVQPTAGFKADHKCQ
jgi:para-nitrobenzyl esterase